MIAFDKEVDLCNVVQTKRGAKTSLRQSSWHPMRLSIFQCLQLCNIVTVAACWPQRLRPFVLLPAVLYLCFGLIVN